MFPSSEMFVAVIVVIIYFSILALAVHADFPEESRNAWKDFFSFFWVKKEKKISKEADEIAAEFGRKILREVRELGGNEDDLVFHNDFARRREIAREVMRVSNSRDKFCSHGLSRQGDFVQVDTGVSVFPDCDTVSVPPKKTGENL